MCVYGEASNRATARLKVGSRRIRVKQNGFMCQEVVWKEPNCKADMQIGKARFTLMTLLPQLPLQLCQIPCWVYNPSDREVAHGLLASTTTGNVITAVRLALGCNDLTLDTPRRSALCTYPIWVPYQCRD